MIDKVFREHYYPGSIYKPVSAIAAIEENSIKWSDTIKCKGWHSFGRRLFRCSHAHDKVDLHQAIVESCNVYFYDLAEKVGMDAMAQHARRFGFGAPTGLGLNGEVSGFIPTKEWYARRKIPFRIGFTLNTAIGQGSTKVTPIQAALFYAALGNGGTLYVPQIVERMEDDKGQVLSRLRVRVRRRLGITPDTLNRVREALHGVVQDDKGTAYASRINGLEVSGKTGTAQVVKRQSNKTYWQKDHAWFAGYAPSDNPKIALAVVIEHGGKAAKVAVPIAMEVFSSYYKFVQNRQGDSK
jgi:penicillin-binding protein 2